MTTQQIAEEKQLIHYRTDGGVAIVELDDPPANTYSYEMMQQLDGAILKARMDPEVHVIVLRGAGEKFFCAGASIPMLTKADPSFKYYFCLHANETLCRLEQTPKLVIAALNGHTVLRPLFFEFPKDQATERDRGRDAARAGPRGGSARGPRTGRQGADAGL